MPGFAAKDAAVSQTDTQPALQAEKTKTKTRPQKPRTGHPKSEEEKERV